MNTTITSKDFSTLVELFKEDAGATPEYWVSFNRFFISSGVNEFILRINEFTKELIISRIEVNKKEKGIGKETLEFLKQYALKNGFEKIVIDSSQSNEMREFAFQNGFSEQPYTLNYFQLEFEEFHK